MQTWKELFPQGRLIFYEGDDPEGFVSEIKARFGFDPSLNNPSWGEWIDSWTETDPTYVETGDKTTHPGFVGYAFHCPADLLDAIYTEYEMGS